MPKIKLNAKGNITLTGLMGSGKSTIGRHLAYVLNKDFIDTDEEIENREGKSINEIFKDKGEKHFRKLEQELIKEVCQLSNIVMSLGGGAIIDEENRKLIKRNSSLVTLIADPQELYDRVKRRKNRPLLKGGDQLETLHKLWEERKPAYMDSHLQIKTGDKSINLIAREIMKFFGFRKPKIKEFEVMVPSAEHRYKILYRDLNKIDITSLKAGPNVLIVSQSNIAKKYLAEIKDQLSTEYKVHSMEIADGEEAKNFITYQLIIQKLLSLNFERKDTIIALGGGVVGDTAGFAASTYYRGINYVQIPTTLLSMIDSSVGGKTAVNVPEGKNLIGTFYQPNMVHIDSYCLRSLPEREYKSGLGEMVKYALLGMEWDHLIGDSFFEHLINNADAIVNKDHDVLNEIIDHCLRIKSGIVAQDEKEKGIRAYLNLGHTFGHAIEELTQYKRYSHGEAVAMGIISACYLSEELGYFKEKYTSQIKGLMDKLELNYTIPKDLKAKDLIDAFKYDKKVEAGKTRFIIPKSNIGRVEIVSKVDDAALKAAIERNRA
ncbi:MAG: 3-dehydroquinate synthase [Candidatus Melainabacteria bacterium]|jgi:shikimate kinase / 3-dehydroquinate synthase|nr:3-dehydroquinate synthase [Candidatus Melainabacteria bacterium]